MEINDWVTAGIAVAALGVAIWAGVSSQRSAKASVRSADSSERSADSSDRSANSSERSATAAEESLQVQRDELALARQQFAAAEAERNKFAPRWEIIPDGDAQWLLWNQNGEPAENVVLTGRQDFAPAGFGTLDVDQKGKFRCVLGSQDSNLVHVEWRRPNGEPVRRPVMFPWTG